LVRFWAAISGVSRSSKLTVITWKSLPGWAPTLFSTSTRPLSWGVQMPAQRK
jgi:hypothetical protein